MGDQKPLVDSRGNHIEIGVPVVWAGRRSSSLWLSTGMVMDMGYDMVSGKVNRLKVRREFTDRIVYITRVGNVLRLVA